MSRCRKLAGARISRAPSEESISFPLMGGGSLRLLSLGEEAELFADLGPARACSLIPDQSASAERDDV